MFGTRLQAYHRPLCSTEVRKASVCTAGDAGRWLCILQSSWSLEGLCEHHWVRERCICWGSTGLSASEAKKVP